MRIIQGLSKYVGIFLGYIRCEVKFPHWRIQRARTWKIEQILGYILVILKSLRKLFSRGIQQTSPWQLNMEGSPKLGAIFVVPIIRIVVWGPLHFKSSLEKVP